MLDFDSCSFRKMDAEAAESVFWNYLSYLDTEYSNDERAEILAKVNAQFSTFLDCYNSELEDLFSLSVALRSVGNNPGGRMVVLWYLSCHGEEIAVVHMLKGLHGFVSMARHCGPVINNNIHSALESWEEEQKLHFKKLIPLNSQAQKKQGEETAPSEGKIVLQQIGDADSTAGKELVKRFACMLDTPLPLRGAVKNPGHIAKRLEERFPWATDVIEDICHQIALLHRSNRSKGVTIPPILLLGAPGCGKTQFLTDLYRMMDIPSTLLPCGGTSDSGGLLAVARGWSTSRPNGCIQAMLEKGCANPAIILDEIDKASSGQSQSANGNIMDTLLSMTDGNDRYYDSCLLSNVDLTGVNFAATANSVKQMPDTLKDRFTILRMPSPSAQHFDTILENLLRAEAARLEVRRADLPKLSQDEILILRDMLDLTDGSIRQVKSLRGIRAEGRDAQPDELRGDLAKACCLGEVLIPTVIAFP
jgi:hypothetical protein